MATKLADFLQSNKIDARRLLNTSAQLEKLRPEDRAILLKKAQRRGSEDKKEEEALPKPRSGRPVSKRSLDAALAGGDVAGPTKSRILRAVNHLLGQKKQDAVDLRALFELPTKGNKKAAEAEAEAS